MERSDEQLLRDWCVRRDALAFQAMVQRHATMVFHTALRILNNRVDAEDATQECFEALVEVREVTHIRSLGAWLHGMATNRSLKYIRSSSRRVEREARYSEASLVVTEAKAWRDIYPIIDEAIQSLDDRFREPVIAHFLSGESQAAIAQELEVSRRTVGNRINEGIEQVEAILKKQGVLPGVAFASFLTSQLAQAVPVEASLVSNLGRLALAQGKGAGLFATTTVGQWAGRGALAVLVGVVATIGALNLLRGPHAEPQLEEAVLAVVDVARVDTLSTEPEPVAVTSLAVENAVVLAQEEMPAVTEAETAEEDIEEEDSEDPEVVGLRGRAIDSNGDPVPGAQVFANQSGMGGMRGDVFADDEGYFVFSDYQETRSISLSARLNDLVSKPMGPTDFGSPELSPLEMVMYKAGSIEGVVVDGVGEPLDMAGIIPRWSAKNMGPIPGTPRSESHVDGTFDLFPLSPGEYDLWLLPPGTNVYLSESFAHVTLAEGEEKTGVRVVYDDREGFELSGIVTDGAGKPLSGAGVELNGALHTRTKTDGDGHFRIARLPDGAFQISAWHRGYTGSLPQDVRVGTTDIEIVLDAVTQLSGRVVHATTGDPVTAFEIHVRAGHERRYSWGTDYAFQKFSNAEGYFDKTDVSAGKVTLIVRAEGYATQFVYWDGDGNQGSDGEVLVSLEPGGVLFGTVLKPDGTPAEGALLFIGAEPKVYRWDWHKIAVTTSDAAGAFQIDSLTDESTMITAYLEGLAPTTLGIPPVGDMTITLTEGSMIEGTVSVNGTALAKAYVHVEYPDRDDVTSRGYVTDENGLFEAKELAEGMVRLRADQKLGDGDFNQRSIWSRAEVKEGMVTSVAMDFSETNTVLSGRILYNNNPLPYLGISLRIESADGSSYSYQVPVGDDGAYSIFDIVAGNATFSLSRRVDKNATSGSRTKISIDFSDGQSRTQDVLLTGPERIDDEQLNPWRGATQAFWNAWLGYDAE